MTGQCKRSARSRRVGVAMVLATALLAAGSSGARGASDDAAGFTPVELTGCNGFTSTITAPPERVLVTQHSEAALLDRLGVLDRVVGMAIPLQPVALPQDLIDKIKDLPLVYSKEDPYGTPSAENLAAIDPDFVVAGFQSFFKSFGTQVLPTQDEYEADGVGSYLLRSSVCDEHEIGTEEDLYADIENLGRVFGAEDKASALIDELKDGFSALTATLEGVEERPTVYLLEHGHGDTDFTVPFFWGQDSSVPGLIARAGGTSILADEPTRIEETSWEVLASEAPEYIVLCDYGTGPSTSQAFFDASRQALLDFAPAATIPAVKNDQILYAGCEGIVGYNLDTLPTIEAIARGLHPDLFG